MANNQIKEDLAQMHRSTSANIIKDGSRVTGQVGHMLCGQPIAKGYFVEVIVFKGKVSYLKNICFGPQTLIT